MKPITVWGFWVGPNPWKVMIILKELDIPFEYHMLEFADMKKEPYTSLNPNGRVPTIEDPNTGVKLWESGAIILYLIDRYDPEQNISIGDFPAKFECIQWLMFQIRGQGPYFGQLAWFARFHQPYNPDAVERYVEQTERVFGVLDKALEQREWLVGGKCTFADLGFVTWSQCAHGLMIQLGKPDVSERFPHYTAWYEAMSSRKPVRECLEVISAKRVERGLPQ